MAVLQEKVALIAGGTRGMGKTIAQLFAREGCGVALSGRDKATAEDVAQEIGPSAMGIALEVADRCSWQDAIAKIKQNYGRLDILVNSAGICVSGTIDDTDDDNWRRHMSINLDGVFYGCQMAIPLMRASGGGSIITVASINGLRPLRSHLAYSTSKAAVTAMTKSIALQCAMNGSGIRANLIHPGGIQTEMFDQALEEMNMPREDALARVVETHPMGRIGKTEEVAQAALWLASDASSFTTGADLTVDGGSAIRN